MARVQQPELKKYMDRPVYVTLNASRAVSGTLRGYDMFLNLVIDEAYEELGKGERVKIGTSVIRGNSVVSLELTDTRTVRAGGGTSGYIGGGR